MNDRQEGFDNLHISSLRDGCVEIIRFGQVGVTTTVVGDDGGAWCYGAFDEATQRLGASIRHQGKLNTTGVLPVLPLVEAAGTLALTDFYGTCHENLVVDAASFATRTTAHVGFISLDDD